LQNPIFTGVCTALVTPFKDGAVNYTKLEELLEYQIDHGIKAVVVCGTTGESATLSDEEQLNIIAHSVQHCHGRMKVIAGSGSNNTQHAVHMSKIASSLGADAVLVVSPYYNKASEQGLIAHYLQVAEASHCPVILYNVPSRTGVDIPVNVYAELSQHPNIAGIKEACGNISKVARTIAQCRKDFCVWSGNDDQIVPIMSLGGAGVISVLSNICPNQTLAMTDACLRGDYIAAGRLQCEYIDLIDALFCEVNPSPIKEALNLIGFSVGQMRLPLCNLSVKNLEKLKTTLQKHRLLQ